MPPLLRSRAALVALFVTLLIPIGMSSLRGLTHVLTCSEQVETPFTVIFGEGDPIVLSSVTLMAGDAPGLCGGLEVDIQAATTSADEAELTLVLANATEFPWRGTVNMELRDQGLMGTTLIPVNVGRVEVAATVTERLSVRLGEGAHEFNGRLLIGP